MSKLELNPPIAEKVIDTSSQEPSISVYDSLLFCFDNLKDEKHNAAEKNLATVFMKTILKLIKSNREMGIDKTLRSNGFDYKLIQGKGNKDFPIFAIRADSKHRIHFSHGEKKHIIHIDDFGNFHK